MDSSPFIVAAYAITGVLIAGLAISTWMRVRRAKKQLDVHKDS